ncbi:hypothetical protein [Methylocystis sp.]|uniref:hypothetical protein n=1 Tax=Methylocystis sp. TaxID=1911079 RepID=UPI003DA493C9
MISDEKQYEFVGSMLKDRLDRGRDALRLFLQLFSAIVGGSIWLSIQDLTPAGRMAYERASNALIVLLIVVTGAMIWRATAGWWGYRQKLSEFEFENHPAPPPKCVAILAEALMLICMVAAGGFFIYFNPFNIPSN